MAFSYCPHCGFKNLYSIRAPKFCGGCGESIQGSRASAIKKLNPSIKKHKTELEDDPDGSDVFHVPELTSLAYSIEHDQNKFALKDMVPLPEPKDSLDQPKVKKTRRRGRSKKA